MDCKENVKNCKKRRNDVQANKKLDCRLPIRIAGRWAFLLKVAEVSLFARYPLSTSFQLVGVNRLAEVKIDSKVYLLAYAELYII